MKVNFRLHDQPNSVQTINVPSCNTAIQQIRTLVAKSLEVDPEQVRLIYAGKQLEDCQTLFQFNFKDADTISTMLRNIYSIPESIGKAVHRVSDANSPSPSIDCAEIDANISIVKNAEGNEEEQPYFCEICENNEKKKYWGRGKACVGLSKKCTVVDLKHVGPIPGVPVGSSWRFRINVAEAGVHRPPVAGIAGKASIGAVSIVLAAGYPEDKDEGLGFTYTGAGGRNLENGNKRVAHQTKDQVLEGVNEALARTCDCPVNVLGGVAKNWGKSRAVRVIRISKLRKHNAEYAPLECNRYDGIYKIVKRGESGFDVWRYLMRRDDPEPAPWTVEGKKRIKAVGVVMYDPDAAPAAVKDRTYSIPDHLLNLMEADSANARSWRTVQQRKLPSFTDLLKVVFEDVFSCPICKDKVMSPVTSSCGHNTCQRCLSDAFKNMGKQCPTCRADLIKYKVEVNDNLEAVFSELMTQNPDIDTAGNSGKKEESKPKAKVPTATSSKPTPEGAASKTVKPIS
ncbi:ubiquitin-like with PHD and RING finger domains 2, partial [Mortierella sp. AD094]